jgi:1,2-dihydroxy-3-keto-5-methylthiopentene dioxygenase
MAVLRIIEEDRTLTDSAEIREYLAAGGVEYERWPTDSRVGPDAEAATILRAYAGEIQELNARGGYVKADVIDVTPAMPGLEEMLAKFSREHWHDEDEVRFVIAGHGVFHLHSQNAPVVAIEVEAGDLIRIPRGTLHWFDLCADRRIRAIRLFQDVAGWTPHYSNSGEDKNFQPVCFGLSYMTDNAVGKEL